MKGAPMQNWVTITSPGAPDIAMTRVLDQLGPFVNYIWTHKFPPGNKKAHLTEMEKWA